MRHKFHNKYPVTLKCTSQLVKCLFLSQLFFIYIVSQPEPRLLIGSSILVLIPPKQAHYEAFTMFPLSECWVWLIPKFIGIIKYQKRFYIGVWQTSPVYALASLPDKHSATQTLNETRWNSRSDHEIYKWLTLISHHIPTWHGTFTQLHMELSFTHFRLVSTLLSICQTRSQDFPKGHPS